MKLLCRILVFGVGILMAAQAASVSAQTAVAPGTGDGLTEATAFEIANLENLLWMSLGIADNVTTMTGAHYKLVADIDATETQEWTTNWSGTNWSGDDPADAGFPPIGQGLYAFTGVFQGENHVISNLFIQAGAASPGGLFSYFYGASVSDLGLENLSVVTYASSDCPVGGLAAYVRASEISNCYVTGSVDGSDGDCSYNGGMFGDMWDDSTVSECYVVADVSGPQSVGGLAGYATSCSFEKCYAIATVSGGETGDECGGFLGTAYGTTSMTDCYARGAVTGDEYIGGLAGRVPANDEACVFTNCYSTCAVSGNSEAQALFGYAYTLKTTPRPASNKLDGASPMLTVDDVIPTVTDVYYNSDTAGVTDNYGSPLTTAEMIDSSNFSGFDFTSTPVWGMQNALPYLVDDNHSNLTYKTSVGGTVLNSLTSDSGSSHTQVVNHGASGVEMEAVSDTGYSFLIWDDGATSTTRTDTGALEDTKVTAIFFGSDVITPNAPLLSDLDDQNLTVNVSIDANGNLCFVQYAIRAVYGSVTKYVQADGTLGDDPVYLPLTAWNKLVVQYWGTPKGVSGLPDSTEVEFSVRACDLALFTYSAWSESSSIMVPVELSGFELN